MTAVRRCGWAPLEDPAYLAYHDEEWGVPVHDDARLFEMLTLEGAQAGLSWSTILHKREGYRRAFAGFDPAKVARFDARKVERLMQDASIVRNRLKIESTVANARATLVVPEGVRLAGCVSVGSRRRRACREPLARWRHPRGDASVTRDEQGPQAARLPVRGSDRLLRVHASDRHGQLPRSRLLPLGGDQRDA